MTAATIDASALGFSGRLPARPARGRQPRVRQAAIRQAAIRQGAITQGAITQTPLAPADVVALPARALPTGRVPAAQAPAAAPLRLTRRGRLLITLLVVALGLGLALAGARTAGAGSTVQPVGVEEITVHPGDTLWSLASESAAGGDVRDRVTEIRELNGLRTSDLRAGQALLVPVG